MRVLAVASGPIYARRRRSTLIVGIVGRIGAIEGVLSGRVAIDGTDSARAIAGLFGKSRFGGQIRAIAINGVAMAGLNVVDVEALEKATRVPVVVLTRKRPSAREFMKAMDAYAKTDKAGAAARKALVSALNGDRKFVRVSGFYVQSAINEAELRGVVPTAFSLLRLAHMVATGMSAGVSKGRV